MQNALCITCILNWIFFLNLPTTWNCKRVMSDLMWILTIVTTQATNGNEFFNLCNRLSMTTALKSIKYEYLRWVLTFVLSSIFWLEINNIISMVFKTGKKMKGLHKNFNGDSTEVMYPNRYLCVSHWTQFFVVIVK